jgi:hypothetical protein
LVTTSVPATAALHMPWAIRERFLITRPPLALGTSTVRLVRIAADACLAVEG